MWRGKAILLFYSNIFERSLSNTSRLASQCKDDGGRRSDSSGNAVEMIDHRHVLNALP